MWQENCRDGLHISCMRAEYVDARTITMKEATDVYKVAMVIVGTPSSDSGIDVPLLGSMPI